VASMKIGFMASLLSVSVISLGQGSLYLNLAGLATPFCSFPSSLGLAAKICY
jgi:hypothetical protein